MLEVPTEADQPTYTERDLYVSERTQKRLEEESAPKNTSANYRSQRNLFAAWCIEQGRVAIPCTTATYVEYVAHLIELGRSPNAINAAMSAIRTWMPEDKKPGTKQARGMLNEYKKAWAKRTAVRKAPPVTDELLRAMVATCDLRTSAGLRDRCMLLLGRGALNRRIELADLSIADVAVDDDFVTLHIRSSKTDQEAKGEHTDIPADPDPFLDPVAAVRDWLTALHYLGVREGAFFRALTSRGTLQNRAVAKERGDYVTGDAINDWVRGRAHKAGAKNWQQITAHGLCRGGAQAIAEAGGDPTKQGRWKPGSAVVKREYLDRAQSKAENP
ncbi:integrase [Streptomyces sp. NPDC056231]|uniref:integrase n=1 Tax=Streptomyces sp. NPDC056231 TaxID=3345755 RepID=UPI003AAA6678